MIHIQVCAGSSKKKPQEIMLGKHGVKINSAKNYLAYKIHSFDIAINNNQ